MDQRTKVILLCAGGAALGTAIGYVLYRHYHKNDKPAPVAEVKVEFVQEELPVQPHLSDIPEDVFKAPRIKINYNDISKKPDIDDVMKKYAGEEEEKEPHVISFEAYYEGNAGNVQVILTYYEDDDTLANEKEEIVDNRVYLIGKDTLARFGQESKDDDIVYIRNPKDGIDYQVVRVHGSYQEMVMGETPLKPAKKDEKPKTERDEEDDEPKPRRGRGRPRLHRERDEQADLD